MNINSLYANVGTTPTTNIDAVNPGTSAPGSVAPAAPGAASATISSPAQLLSEMQQLSQQNPAQFKAVAAQVATAFQNAASQASGPQAKVLNGLAAQFSQAAQTGSLQPAQPGQGAQPAGAQGASGGQSAPHHHHHHHGGGGGMSGAVTQAFDSAMSILTQATSTTDTSTTAASTATST